MKNRKNKITVKAGPKKAKAAAKKKAIQNAPKPSPAYLAALKAVAAMGPR